jgi:hypothetical protein
MPHSHYLPERMGSATISPAGRFEAGSFQSFTLVYTAGYFGIDDTGSLKIVHRFASDMGKMQFTDPPGWNYTTVAGQQWRGAGAALRPERQCSPWDKTLSIRVSSAVFCARATPSRCVSATPARARPACACRPSPNRPSNSRCWSTPSRPTTSSSCRSSPASGGGRAARAVQGVCRPCVQWVRPFDLGFKGEDKWGNPAIRSAAIFTLRSSIAAGRRACRRHFDMRRGKLSTTLKG